MRPPARAAAPDGQLALLGASRCTSTASASISRPRSRASCTRSTGSVRSSTLLRQDPVLTHVKLIAEPWDLGEGGYQVGNFPAGWAEWNDKYRDTMRALLEGRRRPDRRVRAPAHRLERPLRPQRPAPVREHQLHRRARRLHARRPRVLQRQAQRGEPRGQPRRPRPQPLAGTAASKGRPTTRRCAPCARASSATCSRRCLLSQGVPMLLAGDETRPHPARQQQRLLPGQRDCRGSTGSSIRENEALVRFTRRLIALRRAHPVLRRRDFFQGRPLRGRDVKDIVWLQARRHAR